MLRNCNCEPCKNCPTLPVVRKCCFCVPVRKGVTIFGYVNLVVSLLSLPIVVYLLVEEATKDYTLREKGEMNLMFHLPLTIVFLLIDVAMTIVMLVGAHKKSGRLLKLYFYFGLVFQLFTLTIDLIYIDFRDSIENAVYFVFLGLNIYLLFLVYNTIRVIEESEEVQYVVYNNNRQVQQWANSNKTKPII